MAKRIIPLKQYGFVSKTMAMESENPYLETTTSKVIDFMFPNRDITNKIKKEMEKIGYNAECETNKVELEKMLQWLKQADSTSQYIYNLQTTVASGYCEYRDFGLLVSLPSAYFKAFEREQERLLREQKRAEKQQLNANKQHIGKVGERLEIDILTAQCVTSFRTDYGTMSIYKFETVDGNILIWKTTNFIEHIDKVKKIKATIKAHNEYNGEKQTELSRVKIVGE